MEETIIPKDCCLCDICNAQITDSDFVVIVDSCTWYEGWLYCQDCVQKYNPKELPVVDHYIKGQSVKDTDLAKPMIFTSW